jgi:hypothetical protein
MTTVTLQMPDEVFAAMREDPAHFGSELRLAAAMNWYRRGAISQEVAASVAGLDRTDFLLALARHGSPAPSRRKSFSHRAVRRADLSRHGERVLFCVLMHSN